MSTQISAQPKFRNVLFASVILASIGLPSSSLLSSNAAIAQTIPLTPSPSCRRASEPRFQMPMCTPSQPIIPFTPWSPPPVTQGSSVDPFNAPGDSALPSAPNPPNEFTIPPGFTL
jgi:hypothetical protein